MKPLELSLVATTGILGLLALISWSLWHTPVAAAIFGFFFVANYGFTALHAERFWPLGIALIIPILTPIFFLLPKAGYIAAVLLAALFALWGLWQINGAKKSPGSTTWQILRAGLPLTLTALSLVIAVFSYQAETGSSQNARFIPRPLFQILLPGTLRVLSGSLGISAVDPNHTIDQAIIAQFSNDPRISASYHAASEREKRVFLAEAKAEVSKQLGVTLRGNEKVSDVLYEAMNQKADSVLGSYRAYLPLITAVGVFFAARTLSIVVCLAVIIVCYLVSALARRAGLLKKITTTIELTRYTF